MKTAKSIVDILLEDEDFDMQGYADAAAYSFEWDFDKSYSNLGWVDVLTCEYKLLAYGAKGTFRFSYSRATSIPCQPVFVSHYIEFASQVSHAPTGKRITGSKTIGIDKCKALFENWVKNDLSYQFSTSDKSYGSNAISPYDFNVAINSLYHRLTT